MISGAETAAKRQIGVDEGDLFWEAELVLRLHSARRVRNERSAWAAFAVTSSLVGSYIVWRAARCWLLHAELCAELTVSCPGGNHTEISQLIVGLQRVTPASEKMSASAAKSSKKELNSNHDGADETSGKGNGGLLFTAIFTFLSNNYSRCRLGCVIRSNCCVVCFDFCTAFCHSTLRLATFGAALCSRFEVAR